MGIAYEALSDHPCAGLLLQSKKAEPEDEKISEAMKRIKK